MDMRYFEIRSPRPDFTGHIGGLSFADGTARVQFDNDRDDHGVAVAEEHQVSPGRSLVLFAQRRKGYQVIELDDAGKPLDKDSDDDGGRKRASGKRSSTPPPVELPAGNASTDEWRAYAVTQGMPSDEAGTKSRDELVALYTKGAGA